MRSGQVFCNLEKYLFCKFASKKVENEGGIVIWRSAVGARNTVIWLKLKKKTLQNATPPWPFYHFTWKFAQRYFSRLQKTWPKRIFAFFATYSASKFQFACFCAINSEKMKNSKIRSRQLFCTYERYLCANFQVKRSNGQGGVAFWRSFFSKSWSKHCIFVRFLVHFWLQRTTFKCL